jgi:hypothetical protein
VVSAFDLNQVTEYVNQNIDSFHQSRMTVIQNLQLKEVLKRKNPYLFKAKDINFAPDLVVNVLDAYLSSSEEGLFGQFLEGLAIFVNQITYNGQKSSAQGIDLEFARDNIRYIVAIKSGPNWGNSGQKRELRENFKKAIKVLRQSSHVQHIQAVLGTCYGKSRDSDQGDYIKICGQRFWNFISGEPNLYIDIVEPLGYEARKRNAAFIEEKTRTYNRLIREFSNDFCDEAGQINWARLVEFNSGNLKD